MKQCLVEVETQTQNLSQVTQVRTQSSIEKTILRDLRFGTVRSLYDGATGGGGVLNVGA
jgi:hypothetical protein